MINAVLLAALVTTGTDYLKFDDIWIDARDIHSFTQPAKYDIHIENAAWVTGIEISSGTMTIHIDQSSKP